METGEYKKIVQDAVTTDYKTAVPESGRELELLQNKLASQLRIEKQMKITARTQCHVTVRYFPVQTQPDI